MSNTATEVRSVVVEREMPFPPDKIWRALTQPASHCGMADEERLCGGSVGHSFKLSGDWGGVDCKVLAVEPNRALSYTWNYAHEDAAYNLESVVSFTLTPTETGGRICAWSRWASGRIRSRPSVAPNTAGRNTWQIWSAP